MSNSKALKLIRCLCGTNETKPAGMAQEDIILSAEEEAHEASDFLIETKFWRR